MGKTAVGAKGEDGVHITTANDRTELVCQCDELLSSRVRRHGLIVTLKLSDFHMPLKPLIMEGRSHLR